MSKEIGRLARRLSGTPAEAGVRDGVFRTGQRGGASLSGTPAEAGVRDQKIRRNNTSGHVSVEPLPKQGCEGQIAAMNSSWNLSQWNPCRSRGARSRPWRCFKNISTSQWNPCRSRGASPPLECLDIAWGIGTFIHPPADLIVFCDFKEHLRDCSSNYYCLSSGSVFIHPSIRFLYPRFQSEVQHPALVPVRA